MISVDLPILDLGPYLAGEVGAREALASELAFVQQNIGFYVIINHGVPAELIAAAYKELERFFALSEEQKLALKIDQTSLGYVPPLSTIYVTSVINENSKKDQNETLITALERSADHPLVKAGTRFTGPNKWPANLPGFRETIIDYQQQMLRLGRAMLPLYALALDLKSDYFDALFTDPVMWSRNSHYPPVTHDDNQFGISPHSDHSFITLLPIPGVAGLEILTQDKTWLPVPPVEGGIVINTGEFMNRWTNGHFIATPHRVTQPPNDRYSIATFFNPNYDTVAEIFESCIGPDNPPKYEPIKLIDYLKWYIDTNYKSDAGGAQA